MTAGAGSGKTRTLTERVIHLINSDIEPERIVAITFTNKAADEMRSRIVKGVGHANKKKLPYIGTFHAFCARILRKEAKNLGRDHNFGIFDNDDSLRVIKKSINSLGLAENKKVSPALLLKGISNAKMELLTSDSLESPLKEVFEDYETRLQEQNAFDFDDLITKVVELLSDNPAKLKKYQDQFDYILVDEYQDINRAQYVFIKLLSQKHGNINVVGDDQQSIYAFRGANIKTFLDFERDWPGAKIVHLGENYRSTGNIVGAAAKVIENNRLQIRKKLWTQNPGGAPVSVLGTYSAEEEADLIASEITERGFRPSAILYRTNAQSRAIEQSLNFHSIPYEMYGGVKFYDRKEIKDILAPLRYALNPKDQVSRERIEKAFLKKISEKLITELPKMAQTLGLMELIGYILKTTDYFEYLIKKFDNALERTENVRELISFASEFNSLGDFMERVALLNANDSINRLGEKDAPVKLMTIHLAKGLEFDDVYIAGVDDGVLPHHRSFFNEEDIEEERNLTLSFHSIASRFLYEMPPELIKFKKAGQFEEETIYLD
ncbi:MAG: ATP-dependent DNA helicase pcra [Candidatus Nomurabacteria bacterium GW2011_GWA1_46_11]|uniref:DNA 3'-5' helicase n=1 Tax=Candidatus Nomurabacteria bacterium GW2011_GWA1_46_11 TaxID=1618732 RepID=A0A0G1NNU5_9BACT|nr:MAG: ATP-dependent DNA helicase pcra [Candidatus Nomurabacteria bacterium GW2011_GWA1_46_11]